MDNMDRKQLFSDWTPNEGYMWTKFAKPALFVHAEDVEARQIQAADIPLEIRQFNDNNTAVIVDLPSAKSVESGLGLAKIGFRPIPLYNGIHEIKNGGLRNIIDNTDIINALVAGANILKNITINAKAAPAFLIDSNRDKKLDDTENMTDMYDNRWNVDLDDMPSDDYMKEQGILRVVVWSDGDIQDDLKPIIENYRNAGINIVTYINGQITHENPEKSQTAPAVDMKNPEVLSVIRQAAREFENARFGLLIVVILAAFNLIGMFFVNEEPFLWIAPCIMWLTYLWVPESLGDIIALAISGVYFGLYLASHKKRNLLPIACAIFAFDVTVFYIYVLYYGIIAFTGYSFFYGIIVFIPPIVLLSLLIKGAVAYKQLEKISDEDYSAALDHIDGYFDDDDDRGDGGGYRNFVPRRRIFRPYRSVNYRGGFGGYGGTGRSGGGYRGGYGGYGGFGG